MSTRVLHLSDWHTTTEGARRLIESNRLDAEQPDLLAVTGDMVRNFQPRRPWEEHKQRAVWVRMVEVFKETWPNAPIVAVPGNHDFCDYAIDGQVASFDKFETATITVGNLKFTGFRGVPYFIGCWSGEFGASYFKEAVAALDSEADIVITHTPPYGILDAVNDVSFVGDVHLQEWFERVLSSKRRLHLFGHIHECGGLTKYWNGVTFSNASGSANWLTI